MNDEDKNKEKEQVMATQEKKASKPVKKEAPKKDDAELARLKAKLQETDSENCPFC